MPAPERYGDTDHWLGTSVVRTGKLLYIYDHREEEVNWKGAATVTAGTLTRANVAGANLVGFGVAVDHENSFAKHAVVHKGKTAELYSSEDDKLVVLKVTTQPQVAGDHRILTVPANIVEFAMKDRNAYRKPSTPWLEEFLLMSFEDATSLCKCVARSNVPTEFERTYARFLDIIFPDNVDVLLAFRLLCEAHQAAESGEPNVSGVDIHSPKTIDHWLKPFGGISEDEVANLMGIGVTRDKARGVLNAVRVGDPNLKELINEFLEASTELTTVAHSDTPAQLLGGIPE